MTMKASTKTGLWTGKVETYPEISSSFFSNYSCAVFQKTAVARGFRWNGLGAAVVISGYGLSAEILNIESSPAAGAPGSTVTWTYTVNANMPSNVLLGASLRAANGATYGLGTGASVQVTEGGGTHSVTLTIPSGIPSGSYTLRGATWIDRNFNFQIEGNDTLVGDAVNFGTFTVNKAAPQS